MLELLKEYINKKSNNKLCTLLNWEDIFVKLQYPNCLFYYKKGKTLYYAIIKQYLYSLKLPKIIADNLFSKVVSTEEISNVWKKMGGISPPVDEYIIKSMFFSTIYILYEKIFGLQVKYKEENYLNIYKNILYEFLPIYNIGTASMCKYIITKYLGDNIICKFKKSNGVLSYIIYQQDTLKNVEFRVDLNKLNSTITAAKLYIAEKAIKYIKENKHILSLYELTIN